jgi:peptidoglycan hydrolase-like protein with peptidoglycan-binding domain
MATASEVLAQLAALAGEKETNSNNITTVTKFFGANGQAYCGYSIWYAMKKAGSALLSGCSNPAYVPTIRAFMDSKGWRVTDNAKAQAGDIFVYGSDQHVGFVYAPYSGNTVITLEGNSTVYATLAQAKASTAGSGSFEGIGYKKRYLNSSYKVYRPTYDGATATTTMTSGTSSTGVTAFQKWLGVTADGVYGPVTKKAAVKALQKALNSGYSAALTVDGAYGALTKAALTKHPVKSGATGDLVYVLQGLLYGAGYDPGSIDGEFGSKTLAAVKKFQSAKGLTVDGVAGADTFSALCAA